MNQEQIKKILDNAPEGATHYSPSVGVGGYYKVQGYSWYLFSGGEWVWRESPVRKDSGPYAYSESLSDLSAQLEPEQECKSPLAENWDGVGEPECGQNCIHDSIIGKIVIKVGDDWGFVPNGMKRLFIVNSSDISHIETEAERLAREREEAAIHIHDIANEAYFSEKIMDIPDDVGWEFADEDVRRMWLAVVDLTGYRKEPTND